MKRLATICMILAQVAGYAADNSNAELLCVWKYKTLFTSTSTQQSSADVAFTEVNAYYFFSDNSFVKASFKIPFDDVLKMKASTSQKWMTVNNNLILLDENGKQEMGIVDKNNQPVANLLKGEKEMTQVVALKTKTVPSTYDDVLAFSLK